MPLAAPGDLLVAHSPTFVLLAAACCMVTAFAGLALSDRAEAEATGRWWRPGPWTSATATLIGLGVWLTHFTAMLGYRPDAALTYDPWWTVASALAAVGLVGAPVALAARRRDHLRGTAALGAMAGAGVGVMHFVGMAALRGCTVAQSWTSVTLALAFGAALMAGATTLGARSVRRRSPVLVRAGAGALFVLAVVLLHFAGMAGVQLTDFVATEGGVVDRAVLAKLLIAAALLVLLAGVAAMRFARGRSLQRARDRSLLHTALANMTNGLLIVDGDGRVLTANPRFRELFRLERRDRLDALPLDELLERMARNTGGGEQEVALARRVAVEWMSSRRSQRGDFPLADGRTFRIGMRAFEGGAVFTYDDVSEVTEQRERLVHMAHNDALTGVGNRHSFETALENAISRGEPFCIALLDLDRFKEVNDTLGHAAGDALLARVGDVLRANAREGDVVARLGGDEFAALLRAVDAPAAERVGARLVRALCGEHEHEGQSVETGASVGIAEWRPGADANALLGWCDHALYAAKNGGRGTVRVFDPSMVEAVARRRRLEHDLRGALERGEFALAFQPLYDTSRPDRPFGFETLLRWHHPDEGFVSPGEFIPIAEASGIMGPIGEWVLREACRRAATWPADVHVAINVSPVQLADRGFPAKVVAALDAAGLSPQRLEIEMTETAMVEDIASAVSALAQLRALGVRVSMDDFGTGYSSLTHLRTFDLDRIKVDRSFVAAALDDRSAMAVLRAVIAMGGDLGVPVLGEGVETAEQLDLLVSLGCDGAQGYFLGRPMSGAAADDLVGTDRERRAPTAA